MEHRHTHSAHMIRLTHMTVESITDRNDCTNVQFGEPMGFLLGLRRGMLVKVLKEEDGTEAATSPDVPPEHGERFWSSLPCAQ